MKQELKHYEFFNSETGNVISYHSLPAELDEKACVVELEKKRKLLATEHKLFFELIYWKEKVQPNT